MVTCGSNRCGHLLFIIPDPQFVSSTVTCPKKDHFNILIIANDKIICESPQDKYSRGHRGKQRTPAIKFEVRSYNQTIHPPALPSNANCQNRIRFVAVDYDLALTTFVDVDNNLTITRFVDVDNDLAITTDIMLRYECLH